MSKAITFLIKPASGNCNMRCHYCFYEDITTHREFKNYGIMSEDTAKRLIDLAFETIDFDGQINFAFQGGEPTLAGFEFFENFVRIVNEKKTQKTNINFAIQTNALHLDEKWASFFKENNFLVGVSVDGSKKDHDRNRIDSMQEGTYIRIVKAIEILQKTGVDINALCVVTGQTDPFKTYSQLKKLGFEYIQFIPCLDPYEEPRGQRPYSLSAEHYSFFLCNLFDLWYNDWKSGHYVSIRLFDDYVHLVLGIPASTCATMGRCGSYYVVEADGSVYPCDFYVTDKWRLGNINDSNDKDSLVKIAECEKENAFLSEGLDLPEDCKACKYKRICNGGCKRDRDYCGTIGKNYYCSVFEKFFEYAGDRLAEIAKAEFELQSRIAFNKQQ